MDASVINIRTNAKLKREASQVASQLGLNLSSVLNGFLREFVRSKTVNFSLSEEPSEYLIKAIKEAEEEHKKGNYYSFQNSDEAIAFLDSLIKTKK